MSSAWKTAEAGIFRCKKWAGSGLTKGELRGGGSLAKPLHQDSSLSRPGASAGLVGSLPSQRVVTVEEWGWVTA